MKLTLFWMVNIYIYIYIYKKSEGGWQGDNKQLSPLENGRVRWIPSGMSPDSFRIHSRPLLLRFFEQNRHMRLYILSS